MAFHNVRFPAGISLGASGGPERRTEIVVLGSGAEERNSRWADSKRSYNAGYSIKSLDDLHWRDRLFRGAARTAARVPLEGLGGLQVLRAGRRTVRTRSADWRG
jgi:uncharacterized protein (TIGR02217 family)